MNHPVFPARPSLQSTSTVQGPVAPRDSVNDTPEQRLLRDEIEALIGSLPVGRGDRRAALGLGSDDIPPSERETEPNIDVELCREALRAAGK